MKLIEILKKREAKKLIKQAIAIILIFGSLILHSKMIFNIGVNTGLFSLGIIFLLWLLHDHLMHKKDNKLMDLMVRVGVDERHIEKLNEKQIHDASLYDALSIELSQYKSLNESLSNKVNRRDIDNVELFRRLNNAIDMNNKNDDTVKALRKEAQHLRYSRGTSQGNYTRLKAEHIRLKEMVDCVVDNIEN